MAHLLEWQDDLAAPCGNFQDDSVGNRCKNVPICGRHSFCNACCCCTSSMRASYINHSKSVTICRRVSWCLALQLTCWLPLATISIDWSCRIAHCMTSYLNAFQLLSVEVNALRLESRNFQFIPVENAWSSDQNILSASAIKSINFSLQGILVPPF